MPTGRPDRKTNASALSDSPKFRGVKWSSGLPVINQDRNQHCAPPKIHVADAVSVHYWRLAARTAPVRKKSSERTEAMFWAAKGSERAIYSRRGCGGDSDRASSRPMTFVKAN